MAGLGYWAWYPADDRTIWSPAVYTIHGLDPALPPPDLAGVLSLYESEDAAELERLVGRAISHGEPYALRARIHRPDGGIRHITARGEARHSPDGAVERLFGVFLDITSATEAEEALRRSEARLRHLTDNSADVITRVEPGKGVTWVSGACRRYGYEPEDLLGLKAQDLIHPDDRERVLTMRNRRLAGLEDPPGAFRQFRFRCADGRWIWAESNPTIVRDAAGAPVETINVMRDITERMEIEEALRASELRYRVLTENSTDLITRSTRAGELFYASPALNRLTGFSLEDLARGPTAIIERIHPDDVESCRAGVRQVMDGKSGDFARLTFRFQRADGQWIWLESTPTLLRGADGEDEIIDLLRDVSAQRQIEEDLRRARDSAESAARAKSDFLANMSHEIRTPLTAILGFSGLLSDLRDLPEQAGAHVARLKVAGQALQTLVNDILDFSKLEAGQMSFVSRPVAVRELLDDSLQLLSGQAQAKGLTLTFAPEAGLPDGLLLDPDRVRQVLLNLVSNAVKFTDAGGVTVHAAYRAGRLRVSVTDTGAGLDAEQQARLFQRFSQIDGSTTRRHGGTGLGLAICRGLVEAMDGEIGVTSTPARGSIFHFELPAEACDLVDPADAEASAWDTLAGARVLVVDDNAMNRDLARTILELVGIDVTEAADGATAVAIADRVPVDLILMDLRMPGMDGPQALAAIRKRGGPNERVPVLAFSADDATTSRADLSIFDGFVGKPISPTTLLGEAARVLA